MGGRARLAGLLAGFRAFLESTLFDADLDVVLALSSQQQLEAFIEGPGADGDFSRFVRAALDLGLNRLGRFTGPCLSFGAYDGLFPSGLSDGEFLPARIAEDVSHSWMAGDTQSPALSETHPDAYKKAGYSWAKAPRLDGHSAEVGALARQVIAKDPLITDIVAKAGCSTVFARVVARVIELAKVMVAAQQWVDEIQLKQPFCVPTPALVDGVGHGLVEAARGSLGHWLTVKDGKIQRYQIIAPTTWNFSPRDQEGQPGPLEQALVGLTVGERGAKSAVVQHVVRSFDPCMVCTAH
jgi:hydrogenase large subunit